MWLINTNTLELEEFIGSDRPDYVILSHTWGEGEVLFSHVQAGRLLDDEGRGSQKIKKTCELARNEGFEYAWIDTCCIDKSSSVELAEAINSMFEWYASAATCYVYLEDLSTDAPIESFGSCRWFSRGWTLQELVAPDDLIFFDQGWNKRGTKLGIANLIEEVTSIDQRVLRNKGLLRTMPVAQRMSWAASRVTTRPEDIAYCLLGLFDVNMPLIYGEGRKKAFFRLQEEIIRKENDLSIFMWRSQPGEQKHRGFLAYGPEEFAAESRTSLVKSEIYSPEFAMTNKGIRIHTALSDAESGDLALGLQYLWPGNPDNALIGVYLRACGGGTYARMRPTELAVITKPASGPTTQRYLSREVHPGLGTKLDSMRDNAVVFSGPFETLYYRYDSTTPDLWWDHDTRTYLRDGNTSFIAFHMFRSEWDNTMEDNRFIIAFGVSNESMVWVSHGYGGNDPLFAAAIRGDLDNVESHGIFRFKTRSDESFIRLNRLGEVHTWTTRDSDGKSTTEVYQHHQQFGLHTSISLCTANGFSGYCVNLLPLTNMGLQLPWGKIAGSFLGLLVLIIILQRYLRD
ncbi:HET domain protein [Ustulina deusta]|nr:HET domain protein [Ustulina deusta]KAI3343190.1 HET domain protein [Ustulina deusta]